MKLRAERLVTLMVLMLISSSAVSCAPFWFAGGAVTGAAIADDD